MRALSRIVNRSFSQPRLTLHSTKRIHRSPESIHPSEGVCETSSCRSYDPEKGPSRVDGEENVMGYHEPEEPRGFAYRPWFTVSLPVYVVPGLYGNDVGRSQEQWPFVFQRTVVKVVWDSKWSPREDGRMVGDGKRKSGRVDRR
jgi:hypothetical protein